MNKLSIIHNRLKDTRYVSNRGIDFFLKNCYSSINYSNTCYSYTAMGMISLVNVAIQMSPTQVAKRLSIGKRRLLSLMGRF